MTKDCRVYDSYDSDNHHNLIPEGKQYIEAELYNVVCGWQGTRLAVVILENGRLAFVPAECITVLKPGIQSDEVYERY